MVRAIECTLIDFCDEVHSALLCITLCFGLYVRANEEGDESIYYIALILGCTYLFDIGWRLAKRNYWRIEQCVLNYLIGFATGSIAFQKVIRRAELEDADTPVSLGSDSRLQVVGTLKELANQLFICCTVFRCATELMRRYLRSGPSNLGSPKRCFNVTFRLDSSTRHKATVANRDERYGGMSQRFATGNWFAELVGFGTSLTQFYGMSHMLIVCTSFTLLLGAIRVAPCFSLIVFGAFYTPVFVESYLNAYLHDVHVHIQAFIYFVVVAILRAVFSSAPFPNARFANTNMLTTDRSGPLFTTNSSGVQNASGSFELFLAAFSHRKRLTMAYCTLVFVPFLHIVFACIYIHQHRAPIVVVPLLFLCVISWLYVYVVVNRIFYVTWSRLDDALRWCSVMSLANSIVGRIDSPAADQGTANCDLDVEIVTNVRTQHSPTANKTPGKNESSREDASSANWARKAGSSSVRISLDGGESEQAGRDIRSLLSAKGVRYLGVIGLHLSIVLLVLYFAVALITYRTWNPLLVSLMLLSLPTQLIAISFFNELATNLGGTSIAYSAILPPSG